MPLPRRSFLTGLLALPTALWPFKAEAERRSGYVVLGEMEVGWEYTFLGNTFIVANKCDKVKWSRLNKPLKWHDGTPNSTTKA